MPTLEVTIQMSHFLQLIISLRLREKKKGKNTKLKDFPDFPDFNFSSLLGFEQTTAASIYPREARD